MKSLLASVKSVSVLMFGVIVPVVILLQAYYGLKALSTDVGYKMTTEQLVALYPEAKKSLADGNDYVMLSLMLAEHANQKTMVNKQVMKVAVIEIGFAVISLGIMFIILGINDGGIAASGEVSGSKFDVKTGSTGVAVFVIGAVMATVGGVLKNDYATVPLPNFSSGAPQMDQLNRGREVCKAISGKDDSSCFAKVFDLMASEQKDQGKENEQKK